MNLRLLTLYIPGLDIRRLNKNNTPFLNSVLKDYPCSKVNTVPVYDLLPMLLTGVYPPAQDNEVKIKTYSDWYPESKILNLIPDLLTTSCQCLLHLFSGSFDLAAVPQKRRRRFVINRSKYIAREAVNLLEFNGHETIFNIAGASNSVYKFIKKQSELNILLSELNKYECRLKFFEIYCLDNIQHWNLDDPPKVRAIYRVVDDFIKKVYKRCNNLGVRLAVISPNGQEIVSGSINIIKELKELKLNDIEYSYFIEPAKVRFWFHSEAARKKIIQKLRSIKNGKLLTCNEFHHYNMNYFEHHGEIFFIPEPGYILFPHDFFNPFANLFLGITNSQERSRIWNPIHRGFHHYLPYHESEKGFILLMDDKFKMQRKECDIIDIAPTILDLIRLDKSGSMQGSTIIKH